jgi:REP element-mobilizing transposase RayT
MSHSYAQNHIHLVFSTKNREKLMARDFLLRLWAYTAAICKDHDSLTFAVGGLGITSIRFSVRPPAHVTAQSLSPSSLHQHHPRQSQSHPNTKRRAGDQEQHNKDQHHHCGNLGVMQRVIKDQQNHQ